MPSSSSSWLDARGAGRLVGILLAAGKGQRFDPDGVRNKLLQPFPDGRPVAVVSAINLLAAVPAVLAVVRPGAESLALQLQAAGCETSVCQAAEAGMGATLVHALKATRDAAGWIVALADMPYLQPETIQALAGAIGQGAQIAAPVWQGRRGNPVAFGRAHLADLLRLHGDEGARGLLRRFAVSEIAVDDPGIVRDIDTPGDLRA